MSYLAVKFPKLYPGTPQIGANWDCTSCRFTINNRNSVESAKVSVGPMEDAILRVSCDTV